ncbi:hypothetical protein [Paracoccus sp. (in: a-proteobacteria)]|uniref:hypothetical protein n=1 Tax=Paracoccus sp. TaxID=267 RepID=UPI0028A27663|nr:hypothetical protein [Paracoccus sp. (in: a-proteobacteria)]
MRKVSFIGPFIVLLAFACMAVYSYKRCGWGMLAYENAFIAALTGECAQQQRLGIERPPAIERTGPHFPQDQVVR